MTIMFTTGTMGYQNPYSAGYAAGYRTASTVAGAMIGARYAYNRGVLANDDPNRLLARTLVGAAAWGIVTNAMVGAGIGIANHIF